MLRIAVTETDPVYTEYLKGLLTQWADKKTEIKISAFLNGEELVSHMVRADEFDVVFIDLSPAQPDGIISAKKLRNMGYQNVLILTAVSCDRAPEGYQVNAYRYYVKPIIMENIKECMNYTLDQMSKNYFQYTYRKVTERIAFRNIICFEIMDHYIDIYTLNGIVHIKGTLKEVQEQCPSYFLRCQRSCIVNIKRILLRRGKLLKLEMGKVVDISPIYLEAVIGAMGS